MSELKTQVCISSSESTGIESEIDLPGIIGDEWSDPEEFLNDFCSDNLQAEFEAKKHFNSPLF
jgi:hypothetical protein